MTGGLRGYHPSLLHSHLTLTIQTHRPVKAPLSNMGTHNTAIGELERVVEEPCSSPALDTDLSEEGKANTRLFCSLCKIAVNSPSQLQEHNRGTKHKTILKARSGLGPIKAYPRLCFSSILGHSGEERTFHCEICNVRVNSEPQLKQHISSRRHRDAAAGKTNPLINQHKSVSSAELMYTVLFPTDLPKPVNYGLLPKPTAIAVATTSSHLGLFTPGPSPHPYLSTVHTTQFNQTLLRQSLYSSYKPVLFSPY
ncbi:hypothetical protein NFI96_014368 [Prochilodus magdalenae]|nr:hypothetical protein NFI96_014368 [Prochilodus magdalenae]